MANVLKTLSINADSVEATSSNPNVASVQVYTKDEWEAKQNQTKATAILNTIQALATSSNTDSTFIIQIVGVAEGEAIISIGAQVASQSSKLTKTINVKVSESVLRVSTNPDNIFYNVGDSVDLSGLVLELISKDSTETITEGYTYSPETLETAGVQTITITYNEKSTSLDVYVADEDNNQKIYEVTKFKSKTATLNDIILDSNVLKNIESSIYGLLSGSATEYTPEDEDDQSTSGYSGGSASKWYLDSDKMLNNIKTAISENGSNFDWSCGLVSNLSNSESASSIFNGSGLFLLYGWNVNYAIFSSATQIGDTASIIFKNVIVEKEYQVLDSTPANYLKQNQIVVDSSTHPTFENFEGCVTFDKDSYAIEGALYNEITPPQQVVDESSEDSE